MTSPRLPHLMPPVFLLADIFRVLAYSTTSAPLQTALYLTVIVLSILEITRPPPSPTSEGTRAEYGLGCFAAFRILNSAQYLFLLDVQKDLQRKKDADSGKDIREASLYERVKWGLELFLNPRGIGWTHEPTSRLRWIPSLLTQSRMKFIIHQIYRLAIFAVLHHMYKLHAALNPYMHREGPSFYDAPWYWRATTLMNRFDTYVAMSRIQAAMSVFFIGLGIGSPRDWPTLHGSWKDAYTVRRFGGRSWHQMFRHTFQTYGKFLSKTLLNLPSNSFISPYIELFTAFTLSGIMHAAGDFRVLGTRTLSSGGSFQFFLLQAVSITLEDAVFWVARKCGFKRTTWWWRYLGYIWVIVWFTCTVPIWVEPLVRAGAVTEFTMDDSFLSGMYLYAKEIVMSRIS